MAGPRTVNIGRESNGKPARVTSATASSYNRLRALGLPAGGLTSTTRDWATQQRWHNEWRRGQRKAYAAPPSESSHCKGTAIDFGGSQSGWMARHAHSHGWRRTNSSESWHWVYFPNLDKRKGAVKRVPARVAAVVTTLRRGQRSKRVQRLQVGLRRKFPSYAAIAADGDYGPATERAVREFQRRAGLRVDGRVGPVTASALRAHGITF